MKSSFSRRAFLALLSFASILPVDTRSKDNKNDLDEAMETLAGDKDPKTREKGAESLFKLSKEYVRNGRAPSVAARLDKLIRLLDDKDDGVVYWVAMTIGLLGGEGKAALPKLEELSLHHPRPLPSKSSYSAVIFAIKRIKENQNQTPGS